MMKHRAFILALIFAAVVLLTACQADPPPTEDPETTVTEQSTETPDVTESAAAESTAPDTASPETVEPETTEPETAEPETTEPETMAPETTELAVSETTEPETSEPALDGVFSTPDYTVSVTDGVCYLNFTEENREEEESGTHGGNDAFDVVENFLAFSSITEMKQAFRENGLTEKQQAIIRTYFPLTEKGYEICNFDQLWCPATPEGFAVDVVYLYGDDYRFSMRGKGELSSSVYLGDAGKYEREYNQSMEIISNHQLDSHTTETLDGVTCESYVISTSVAQVKYVFMTLPSEGKTAPTRVIMRFLLQSENRPEDKSDTVPQVVYIFGEENGMPYDYLILGMSEAPTVEWLSSFGLALYEDETPEAKQ